jgi:predicted GTPase
VLPALGYGEEQLGELAATVAAVPSDVIIVASPVDLRRLLSFDRPSCRVTYEFEALRGPAVEELLLPLKQAEAG